jgi:undecaprenyl-diphosphatase
MDISISVILGAIQGLTEFIPISSSGHLVLVREFLNVNDASGLAFDAVLHLATSLAILIYFREEIKKIILAGWNFLAGGEVEREDRTLLVALVLGTIPVVIVALLFEKFLSEGIREPLIVIGALIAGSFLFWIAEMVAEKNRRLTARGGLITGLFQIAALVPGMSRSGMAISGGLFMGLRRETATRFSFLLAFPIIFGAGMKKLLDIGSGGMMNELGLSLLIGSVVAFFFGLISIHYMLKFLRNHSLIIFAVYRILLAVVVFLLVV